MSMDKGMEMSVPSKIKCFTWLVTKRACFTHEALPKSDIQKETGCFLCNEAAESSNHLFLHCEVIVHLWSLFFSLTGMDDVRTHIRSSKLLDQDRW